MCLTTGDGVDMFVLDLAIGSFLRVRTKLRIPEQGKTYSINEANAETFPEGYQKYLRFAHESGYTSRYIGSMVSDVHRTLICGGVFIYPPTAKNPDGKLRLLYEANPMAMLIEQAGGASYSGLGRTMEIHPERLHQRVPVVLGSIDEVAKVQSFV
jgi:fructose-1,6-bisphosphatase I